MKDLCDLTPEYIRSISPYQPGKPIADLERELGLTHIIKLASNENPLGPSPLAVVAIEKVMSELARYPDGNGFELKTNLAARHHVKQEQIILGNGSNDILEFVARTFLGNGSSAVFSKHSFAVYPLVTQDVGAVGIEVPAHEFGHDLDAMVAAIRPDTRVMFIANPNNPTGTFVDGAALHAALRRVPQEVLVVLDEAYTEFLPSAQRYNAIQWLSEIPNLLVCRTFSKAYGLAGLRVGFGVARADIVGLMNRVRQPFNVNALALTAANAALDDSAFLQETLALNNAGMMQLVQGVKALGLEHIPSFGNFVCIKVGNGLQVYHALLTRGVIVRPVASYQMPQYLRVSVGLEAENAAFLNALPLCLGAGA